MGRVGHPLRPVPADFLKVGPTLSVMKARRHYRCSHEVLTRWYADTGTSPLVVKRSGRTPLPVPADFAVRAAAMGQTKLARHYNIAEGTIRRWLDEAGIARKGRLKPGPKPTKPQSARPKKQRAPARPVPAGFEAFVAQFGIKSAEIQFQAAYSTVKRWIAETGVAVSLRPGPKPAAQPAGVGSVKPAQRRKGAPTGPKFYQPAKDDTLAGRAADYLRRDYAPVYHRGRENKVERGIWQVGQKRLTEAEMIALARDKGFEKPAKPIAALVIRSSILEAQARGDILPPPAGYDRYAPPPVRTMFDERAA